jgi:hypothetical protein
MITREVILTAVTPHVIGEQSFVIGRDRCRNGLPKRVTLAGRKVDPERLSQREKVAPGVAVTFGKLIDQLLYTGGGLGDDLFLFSLPQCYLSIERTLEQGLEVWGN